MKSALQLSGSNLYGKKISKMYFWLGDFASHTNLSSPTSSNISCLLDTPGSSTEAVKYFGSSESIGFLNILKSGSLDISVLPLNLLSIVGLMSEREETSSIFDPGTPPL